MDGMDLTYDTDKWRNCESGNELSGSIKSGEFTDYLRTGQLLKKESATWSWVGYIGHLVI